MNSRERFEAHAAPMGFDLTRQSIAVPEPWAEYADPQTGYFWAGWQAAERGMLERAIAAAQTIKLPTVQVAYNVAVDRVIDKLKELLNEQ